MQYSYILINFTYIMQSAPGHGNSSIENLLEHVHLQSAYLCKYIEYHILWQKGNNRD